MRWQQAADRPQKNGLDGAVRRAEHGIDDREKDDFVDACERCGKRSTGTDDDCDLQSQSSPDPGCDSGCGDASDEDDHKSNRHQKADFDDRVVIEVA